MSVEGVSLRTRGLLAVDGLACPAGGNHFVQEHDITRCVRNGGGDVLCLKCEQDVRLAPIMTGD